MPTLLMLVLLIAACGDGGETTRDDGPRRVEIEATDFTFTPDLVTASAGETIEFVVTNSGAVEHEFRVTDQADIDAHIAGGHEEHMGDDAGDDIGDDAGDDMGDTPMLVLQPGETMTLTVTIPDDPTVFTRFVCLIPGHYEAGMVGQISS